MTTQAEEYIKRLRDEYIDNQKRDQERDLLIQENNIEKVITEEKFWNYCKMRTMLSKK